MPNDIWVAGFVPTQAFLDEVASLKARLDDLETAAGITTIMSGDDHALFVDLNSIDEQSFMVPHTFGAAPLPRRVFVDPVADPSLDLSAVCLEYIRYFPASSTPTALHITLKLQQGSGVAGQQGQLRILVLP